MARILALLLVFFTLPTLAVTVPSMEGTVTDPTGLLNHWQREALIDQLNLLNRHTGTQTAVLVVRTTDGETIEEYARQTFNRWRLGDARRNDGILLLVAWQDRRVRIEVGIGLEEMVTNALAKRIIDEYMIPAFKEDDLNLGLIRGVEGISTVLASQPLPNAQPPTLIEKVMSWFSLRISLTVLAVVIAALVLAGRSGILALLFIIGSPVALTVAIISTQKPVLISFALFFAAIPGFILAMLFIVGILKWLRRKMRGEAKKSSKASKLAGASTLAATTLYTNHDTSSFSSSVDSSSSSDSGGGGGSSDGGGSSGDW